MTNDEILITFAEVIRLYLQQVRSGLVYGCADDREKAANLVGADSATRQDRDLRKWPDLDRAIKELLDD